MNLQAEVGRRLRGKAERGRLSIREVDEAGNVLREWEGGPRPAGGVRCVEIVRPDPAPEGQEEGPQGRATLA